MKVAPAFIKLIDRFALRKEKRVEGHPASKANFCFGGSQLHEIMLKIG